MKLLVLAPSVLLISVLACQSGSGGTGVATSDGEVSNPEHAVSSQDEDRNRSAEREARLQAKIRDAELEQQARTEAARERDREAAERWRAGAGERLQAEAERADNEAEEDVPPRRQQ